MAENYTFRQKLAVYGQKEDFISQGAPGFFQNLSHWICLPIQVENLPSAHVLHLKKLDLLKKWLWTAYLTRWDTYLQRRVFNEAHKTRVSAVLTSLYLSRYQARVQTCIQTYPRTYVRETHIRGGSGMTYTYPYRGTFMC